MSLAEFILIRLKVREIRKAFADHEFLTTVPLAPEHTPERLSQQITQNLTRLSPFEVRAIAYITAALSLIPEGASHV